MDAAWAQTSERGAGWGVRFLALALRRLGRTACLAAMVPVVVYFYVTGAKARRASLDFLHRAKLRGANVSTGFWAGLRHMMSFGESAVGRFAAWTSGVARSTIIDVDGPAFTAMRADPAGAMVLTSHIGCAEVIRACGTQQGRRRIVVLMHSGNAANYARTLAAAAPASRVQIFEVTQIDLGAAIELSQAVSEGAWIVMGADRLPPRGGRAITAPFMGQPANFPEGPFLLASALRCKVYTLFLLKRGNGYQAYLDLFTRQLEMPRAERKEKLKAAAARYAQILEQRAIADPYQWYNFYDFWADAARDTTAS